MELIIRTPSNPNYSGTTFGVRFHQGQAQVNERTPNSFNWTVAQLLDKFTKDIAGYEVEVVVEAQPATVPAAARGKKASAAGADLAPASKARLGRAGQRVKVAEE